MQLLINLLCLNTLISSVSVKHLILIIMTTLSMMTIENGHVSNYRFPSVELLEKRNDGEKEMSTAEITESENRLKQVLEQ